MNTRIAKFLASRLNDCQITAVGDAIAGVRIASGEVFVSAVAGPRDLGGWMFRAESERIASRAVAAVIVHERLGIPDADAQYVTMTIKSFAALLEAGQR